MKRAWTVLIVTLLVVIPVRLYSVFNLVDLKTGFYTDGGKSVGITTAVAVLGVVLVMAFGVKNAPVRPHAPLRNAAAAVFAALSGVFIAGESLVNLAGPGGPSVINGIIALFGVCAAASFLTAAYDFAAGETILSQHPLVALLAPVWGCLCLISLFITYAASVNRFDNIYHTFTVVLLLLFLFSQTKLLSGMDEKGGGRMIFAYGFAAVIAALTDAVPNLALYFADQKTLGIFPTGLYLTNIFLSVYILTYLTAESRRRTSAPMVSIAPDFNANSSPAGKEDQPPEKTGDVRPEKEKTNPEPNVIKFLQKAYRSEDKFVENTGALSDAVHSSKS